MNNKFGTLLAITMIVAGCVVGYFAQFDATKITAFAVTMFGAGLAVSQLWKDRKESAKTWVVILGMALVGVGAFVAGLFSFMQLEQVKTLIGLVFSLIVFVAGLVTTLLANKAKE